MAPARLAEPPVSWPAVDVEPKPYRGPPRKVETSKNIHWYKSLQPNKYNNIFGTRPESKTLFLDVNILDSTGRDPYRGDVFIEGERFVAVGEVPNMEDLKTQADVRVCHERGRTLMSGLDDGHTHFSWNGGDLDQLGTLGAEDHTLLTMRSAQCFIDSGYTMCFGAASAEERLDVVIRDATNAGDIPGPRYLANGREMARRGGALVAGITAFADGPGQMREVIKNPVGIGVDNIKLSMSGEEEYRSAQDCYFTDEETAAYAEEAHKHSKRLCSHARDRDSVIMSVRRGIEAIYHASYIDDKDTDMLEEAKTKHVVVPAIKWLICTLNDAEAFGNPKAAAEKAGYSRELDAAIAGLREMHRRGIVVLPGGDYGFAWTPHETYARDLERFAKLVGFTEHEAIIAATAGVAAQCMQSQELGQVKPDYYADCILVDENPLEDITVLQDHDKLKVICINGRVHKAGRKEYVAPPIAGQDNTGHVIVPQFPTVKKAMQIEAKLY